LREEFNFTEKEFKFGNVVYSLGKTRDNVNRIKIQNTSLKI